MATTDVIRLPVDYKPAPIRNMLFSRYGLAYGELQLPGTVTHPVIAQIAKDIETKLINHFGTIEHHYASDVKSGSRNSIVM